MSKVSLGSESPNTFAVADMKDGQLGVITSPGSNLGRVLLRSDDRAIFLDDADYFIDADKVVATHIRILCRGETVSLTVEAS